MTTELSTTNTLSTFFDQLAKGQTLKTNSSAGLTQGGDDLIRLGTLIRDRRYEASYWTAMLRDGDRQASGHLRQQLR
jgi:hypothetical protein